MTGLKAKDSPFLIGRLAGSVCELVNDEARDLELDGLQMIVAVIACPVLFYKLKRAGVGRRAAFLISTVG